MTTVETLKSQAKRLRSHLAEKKLDLSHSQALEAVAAIHGFKDWNTASAMLATTHMAPPATGKTVYITAGMTIDDVREEVNACLRADPGSIRLRLDSAASDFQHREAHVVAREIEARGVKAGVDSALLPRENYQVDKEKLSKIAAFVSDEKRLNAAFDNVINGIESGRIRGDDFPLAAAPLRAGGLKDNREFVARYLEQVAGQALTPEQQHALQETITALPPGASIEELYAALERVEPLANFTAALQKAQDTSVSPAG